jgi:hypothetical protein
MELVEGRSLDRAVGAGGPLPPRRVAEIGARLLDALNAAHAEGLLHRDVKPANVLLADDGRVILTDFGIAALDGDPALTRTGGLVGSPGFIAPERLRDEPSGPASDLWSLGATLYAAVEGRGPFDRPTPLAALGAVLTERTPRPKRAGALAPVLARLLEKDPGTRIGAAEAATALRRVAAGDGSGVTAPRPRPSPSSGRRFPPRGRTMLAAGIVAIAVVAVPAGPLLMDDEGGDPQAGRTSTRPGPRPVASVDPCTVLTEQQVAALLPATDRRRDARSGACSWLAPKAPATLSVSRPYAVAATPEAGHDLMAVKRNELVAHLQSLGNSRSTWTAGWTFPGFAKINATVTAATRLVEVPGVGDEAVAYTHRGSTPAYDQVILTLREDNVVISIEWSGPRDGPYAAADRARRAATAVAATLAQWGGRG